MFRLDPIGWHWTRSASLKAAPRRSFDGPATNITWVMAFTARSPLDSFPAPAFWSVAAFGFVLTSAAIGLRLQTDGIALFWPAAGVAAGLVLVTRGADRHAVIVGTVLALAIGNISQGRSLVTSAIFMSGNVAEALLLVWSLERKVKEAVRLDKPQNLAILLVAGVIVPVLVGLPVSAALRWSGHAQGSYDEVLWIWVSSHALGLVATTPAVLILGDAVRRAHGRADYPLSVLISAALLAALMPLVLLGAYGISSWKDRQRIDEIRLVARNAELTAATVDRELRSYIETTELVASALQLQAAPLDAAEARLRSLTPRLAGDFILVDRSHRQLINTSLPPGTPPPLATDVDFYRQALETGKPGVPDLVVGTDMDTPRVVIHAPVIVDGEIRYVLAFLPREVAFRDIVQGTSRPEGWFAAVLDGTGRVVARSFRHEDFYGKSSSAGFLASMTGSSGVVRSVDLEGRASVSAYHRSSLTDWRAVVWVPRATLEAPLSTAQQIIAALIAAALSISFGLAWVAGRLLASPSRQLVATAAAIGGGQSASFIPTMMREANVVGEALVEAGLQRQRAETALAHAKRFSQGLVDTAPMLLYIYDLDERRNVYIGPQIGPLLGYSPTEIARRGDRVLAELVHSDDLSRIAEHHATISAASHAGPFEIEYRLRHIDGSWRWLMSRDTVYQRKPDGGVKQIIGTAQDITKRKEAEDAARESAYLYRLAMQVGRLGAWQTDFGRGTRRWTQEAMALFDIEHEQGRIGGEDDELYRRMHPNDRHLLAEYHRLARQHDSFSAEYRIVRSDGSVRWVSGHGTVLTRDATGGPLTALHIALDTTDRKNVEIALSESERRAREQAAEIASIYDTAHVGLCMLDRNLRFVRINEHLAEINGIPAADHIGKTVREILPDLADAAERLAAQVLDTGKPVLDFELSGVTPAQPGVLRYWVEQWVPLENDVGEVVGINVVAEEVTERKRAEHALRESEERLAAALRAGRLGVYDYDPRTGHTKCDALIHKLWGVPETASFGIAIFEAGIHPDDLERVHEAVARALDPAGSGRFEAEYRVVSLDDNTIRWVWSDGDATFEGGTAVRLVGTAQDITAGKEAEQRIAAIRDALSAEAPAELQPLAETRSVREQSATAGQRRAALQTAGLLDAAPERIFDQVTRLAAGVLQTPFSLLTVIDQERQFFVSDYGLSEPLRSARQSPLWSSYCRWVIDGEAPVVIQDAEYNPLVSGIGACKEGFVAYLGTPVHDRDGTVIASLCVADSKPRAWTSRDLLTLQGIARLLKREFENRAIQADLEASRAIIEQRNHQLDLLASSSQSLLLTDGNEREVIERIFVDIAEMLGAESIFHYRPAKEPGLLALALAHGIGEDDRRQFDMVRLGEHLCGRVAQTKQKLVIEDLQHSDAPGSEPLRGAGFTRYAGFPLVAEGQLFGTVAFVSGRLSHFRKGEIQTIQTICDHVATAMERARLQRDLAASERRLGVEVEDLRRVHALGLALAELPDVRNVLRETLRVASHLAGVNTGSAQLREPDGTLTLVDLLGFDEEKAARFADVGPDGFTTCVTAMAEKRRVIVEDVTRDSLYCRFAEAAAPFKVHGAVSTPLLDSSGEVSAMFTLYWNVPHRPSERELRLLDLCAGIAARHIERNAAAEAVRLREERFTAAEEAASGLVYDWDVRANRLWRSNGLTRLTGWRPDELEPTSAAWFSLWQPDDRKEIEAQLPDKFIGADGTYALEYRIRHKDGHWVWVWDRGRAERGPDGSLLRFVGATVDITERKSREEQIGLLMKEVNHRAKNMLGLVQSVARQTASTNPTDFVTRFGERIQALSANQDLLVNNAWTGVGIEDLARAQLALFKDLIGTRISIGGTPMRFAPAAAQAIGLALHELATNAGKYGALSNDVGCVDVTWRLDGEDFLFAWVERGGPPVKPPTRKGFGSTVINSLVKMSVYGAVDIAFDPAGFSWRLTCPAEKALERGRGGNLEQSAIQEGSLT